MVSAQMTGGCVRIHRCIQSLARSAAATHRPHSRLIRDKRISRDDAGVCNLHFLRRLPHHGVHLLLHDRRNRSILPLICNGTTSLGCGPQSVPKSFSQHGEFIGRKRIFVQLVHLPQATFPDSTLG
jgi:hypothetical protein